MKAFLSTLIFAALASAFAVPQADTPSFYLVSSSQDSSANLLPLRTNGGAGGYATLGGSGPIGIFYFDQGKLTAAPNPGSTNPLHPLIGSLLGATGCTTYGSLGFTESGSSNKCARYETFSIQSNPENSQLGARLAFNEQATFFACGNGKDVWYQEPP